MLKRSTTRSKSKRVIIDVNEDYEEQAANIRTTSYPSYEAAKKAVDDWQESAGQLTYVSKEIFPGKRSKRGSQPESVTVICKSAEECPFKCKIDLQADKTYHLLFIATTHTCRPGVASANSDREQPEELDIKIPQAFTRYVTSHHSPSTSKRNKSIHIWRRGVTESHTLPADSEQTSWREASGLQENLQVREAVIDKPKSKVSAGIREAMQPRPLLREEQAARKADPVPAVNSKASERHARDPQTTDPPKNIIPKGNAPHTSPVGEPRIVPPLKIKAKLDRIVGTAGAASCLTGLQTAAADIPGCLSRPEAITKSSQQVSRPALRPNIEYQRPGTSLPRRSTSAQSPTTHVSEIPKSATPPKVSPPEVPPAIPAAQIPPAANELGDFVRTPSTKRAMDSIKPEGGLPVDKSSAAKRHKTAAPEEILLADKKHGLDPHLVNFLAIAGVHHLCDIVNLGMVETDMDPFLTAVYAKMEELAVGGTADAGRIRAAVKNCAEAITIAKVKSLFRI